MSISGIEVVGGSMKHGALTSNLEERIYDIGKAHVWLGMIREYQRPTKWLKPNKKGTNINFSFINSQEDIDKAFDELEIYIREINRKHGTDITLERPVSSGHNESA